MVFRLYLLKVVFFGFHSTPFNIFYFRHISALDASLRPAKLYFREKHTNMELTQLEDAFVDIGGHFMKSAFDLREKMQDIKAIILDWDGVFNNGEKARDGSSAYSLVDTEGLERFRFGYFMALKSMIKTAVISETENPLCASWATIANIDNVYLKTTDKLKALHHFCDTHNLTPSEVIYVFDDINDLPVAAVAGIRLAVGRLSSPLYLEYIEHKRLADYISSCQGNEHAVREMSELLLALIDQHFNVMNHTADFETDYQDFLSRRQTISTSEMR